MSGARQEILRRIGVALDGSRQDGVIPRNYRRVGTQSPAAIVELLVSRLRDYGAIVHVVEPIAVDDGGSSVVNETVADAIADALGTEEPVATAAGFPRQWLRSDIDAVIDDDKSAPAGLDQFAAAVTTCALAIADSGTLILDGGPGQGRRALSLIPDHHVCVVVADIVVETVPEALGRLEATRPTTWVSGPSATSDIELSRVEGVHGPRRLDVVIVTWD